ncbi:hypothetical protein CWR48_03035 [Oceanobacillus arenosus]|uniref:Uncharacterized protein n=1 Tax=Oceanobacillus arenosus TaxID=1229153 RepID=A0A3D8PZD9_9BACI|nr:hypothetical protein CWR48_03035 [Oceanobacillus arenosus]
MAVINKSLVRRNYYFSRSNNKNIKVNVPLDTEHYKIACDTHRDGNVVQVEGVLERSRNRWELMVPENFELKKE